MHKWISRNFWRTCLKYKIYPDICILGKALGNGFSITTILGKREIMESAQNTFISSTFLNEKSGYIAALEPSGYGEN